VVVTVTALGVVHGVIGAVTRAGARAGDVVYVTGALGGSLASGRHAWFVPRVEEAWWLCESAAAYAEAGGGGAGGGVPLRAMMDISDGLGIDADRMARASGVRIEIDAAAVPVHVDVDGVDGEKWRRAMGDGEDYELLVVADGGWGLPREIGVGVGVTALTRIGRVVACGEGVGAGCVVRTREGAVVDASGLGYAHG
jgi:thiamine-monophosphate kinase